MPKCVKIRRKKRQICVGDLDTEIILENRNIAPPLFGSSNFDENFTPNATVWAMVSTVSGKTFFDDVNTAISITHEIGIRFDATVTAETWIRLGSRRIDILDVNDLDERGEFMLLTCTDRGADTKDASKI